MRLPSAYLLGLLPSVLASPVSLNETSSLESNTTLRDGYSFDGEFNQQFAVLLSVWPDLQPWGVDIQGATRYPGLIPDPGLRVTFTGVMKNPRGPAVLIKVNSDGSRGVVHFDIAGTDFGSITLNRENFYIWDWRDKCPIIAAYAALRANHIDGIFLHVGIARWKQDPYLPPGQPMQVYYFFTRAVGPSGRVDRYWFGCADRILRRQEFGIDETGDLSLEGPSFADVGRNVSLVDVS